MTDTVEAPSMRRVMHPMKPRRVTVSAVEEIVPGYVRLTFTGEDLVDFVTLDPDDHMKLVFPAAGEAAPTLPVWGESGPQWPEDRPRPVLRDYTPRRFDPDRRQLEVEFVLHGDGPASTWARQAAPGQQLGILGPRGSKLVDGPLAWTLLIGDETALPAIARRLEEASPGMRVIAVIEVDTPAHELTIATAADADVRWVHRNGAPAGTTTVLEDAVRALELPSGAGFVRAHGEATTLRGIRRHLIHERGIDPAWMSVSGHWKRGVAGHDHHEPIAD